MALFEQYPVTIQNSLSRTKELFKPIAPPHVGLYVCGPTVYGDPHLGHARSAVTFDIVARYLRFLGYRVRYVRNITDVGHLENEVAESGEDKIAKQARLNQVEPMEVVQRYTVAYRTAMDRLGVLPPSIEPTATGHIPEQIAFVKRILEHGYGYEVDGSVYFDLARYAKDNQYGLLSGKIVDDLLSDTRGTVGQQEKRSPIDFALWKKAGDQHLMKWASPWGEGFPGWHIECTVMSTKYLGDEFDIHGGGMDIQFPHHEAEIAQSVGALGHPSVRYWMHHNMLTIDGQKMAKSLGNFITMEQLYSGEHKRLEQAYDPMTIRFFMLQTHYRSPIDFSNEPLQAAEKGYRRLMSAMEKLNDMKADPAQIAGDADYDQQVSTLIDQLYRQMSDDFNTPQALATTFELVTHVNTVSAGQRRLTDMSGATVGRLKTEFADFVGDVLGLSQTDRGSDDSQRLLGGVVDLLISIRNQARSQRDFQTADQVRDQLAELGIRLEDGRDGTTFSLE